MTIPTIDCQSGSRHIIKHWKDILRISRLSDHGSCILCLWGPFSTESLPVWGSQHDMIGASSWLSTETWDNANNIKDRKSSCSVNQQRLCCDGNHSCKAEICQVPLETLIYIEQNNLLTPNLLCRCDSMPFLQYSSVG